MLADLFLAFDLRAWVLRPYINLLEDDSQQINCKTMTVT